ncbi:MAG: hybrid sensor histidine kinase/response regulator [Bdellovibrionota bacterium]|nr:hybrid sensor histidine kinase/response regulator [Bdellovibrionota bacterium]
MKSKILIIDDEVEILNVYERIFTPEETLSIDSLNFLDSEEAYEKSNLFQTQEYEVLRAVSGLEGVELAKKYEDIKVAFIDMRMPPGINGAETAKLIREINPKIEIVIVTAYSDINLGDIVKLVGSPDKLLYLRKPFASEEIEQIALNLVTKYDNTRVKDNFVRNVSHEMKTPLAVLSGYTSILQSEIKDKDHSEFLNTISASATELKSLIDSLIMLSEIKHEKTFEENKNSNMYDVLEDVFKFAEVLKAKYPKVIFEKDVSIKSADVNASRLKLIYVLNNIVDNAFKFTQEGQVVLNVSESDGSVKIKLVDTGIGIPKDKMNYIFERFFRVEETAHSEVGFGLGLSNSKDIIEEIGGHIKIDSFEGEGTEVVIDIPLKRSA